MKVNQEIVLGGGRMMKKATILILKDDGKVGVEFRGKFFKKGDEVKLVDKGKKIKATVLAVRNNHAVLQLSLKSLGWNSVKRYK